MSEIENAAAGADEVVQPEAKPEKPSRFAFVNEYRRRNEEKQIAEAEALRRKFEEKMQRKKKK